jgi:hypothetical protein
MLRDKKKLLNEIIDKTFLQNNQIFENIQKRRREEDEDFLFLIYLVF